MKKLLTFVLCAAMALALCAPAAAYSDVPGEAWYAPAIDYCTERGLMDGMGDGVFAPDGPVTRAQLVTTLWRLAGKPEADAAEFSDVAAEAWYAPAVAWAAGTGVTDGMGDGTFAPDAPLSREQMATFFHRYAGEPIPTGEADFVDQSAIADWAQTAALWAAESGLMQGRGAGVFNPWVGATRAELAQVLKNFDEILGEGTAETALRMAPVGIAFDADGAAIVADGSGKLVWRILGERREVLAGAEAEADEYGAAPGGYVDGAAAEARFASPWGVAPFLDGWAVSDPDNATVRYIREGQVATLNGIDFTRPTGLAAGADGVLYVADTEAGVILKVTPQGKSSVVASGLAGPTGLAWADGKLYIAETDANRILVMADGGSQKTLAGAEEAGLIDGAATTEARFCAPQGVAVGPDGAVYVSDTANAAVRCIRDGQVTTLMAQPDGVTPEPLPQAPMGLAVRGGVLTFCDRFAGVLAEIDLG